MLHQKSVRNKNRNLIAFRIPIELSVTLEKLGVNPKEACRQFLYQIANQNSSFTANFQTKPVLSPIFEKQAGFLVARGRFELPSAGPKPAMLVHYTTGLTWGCDCQDFLDETL